MVRRRWLGPSSTSSSRRHEIFLASLHAVVWLLIALPAYRIAYTEDNPGFWTIYDRAYTYTSLGNNTISVSGFQYSYIAPWAIARIYFWKDVFLFTTVALALSWLFLWWIEADSSMNEGWSRTLKDLFSTARPIFARGALVAMFVAYTVASTLWILSRTGPYGDGLDQDLLVSLRPIITQPDLLHLIKAPVDYYMPLLGRALGSSGQVAFIAAIIGAAVFPLYALARDTGLSQRLALLVCGTYLLFIPLWGVRGYGFGGGILFPAPFLYGLYLLRRGRFWTSVGYMVVLGIPVIYWAVYPLITGLLIMVFGAKRALGKSGTGITREQGGILAGLPAIMIALDFVLSRMAASSTFLPNQAGELVQLAPAVPIWTISILLASLFFIPLVAPRWLVLLIPWLVLAYISNYSSFSGPQFLTNAEHMTTVLPFIFLALIEALATKPRSTVYACSGLLTVLFTALMSSITTVGWLWWGDGFQTSPYVWWESVSSWMLAGYFTPVQWAQVLAVAGMLMAPVIVQAALALAASRSSSRSSSPPPAAAP